MRHQALAINDDVRVGTIRPIPELVKLFTGFELESLAESLGVIPPEAPKFLTGWFRRVHP